ncbi:DUF6923 family protein [Chelativorans oligotrophicus]|nr:GEVED domain-containing protein [Chelativorans oligotrophicus]
MLVCLAFFSVAAPAFADSFYFSRMRALADSEQSATGLFLWNDASNTQTQIGGDGSYLHLSDGTLIAVDGLATNLSGTLYGFAIDNASTAGFVPLASDDYCSANIRSRLVSINTSTAEMTYVGGSWLAGRHISGAGFDGQGRLWAIDCVAEEIIQINPATGAIVGSPIASGTGGTFSFAVDLDFAANGIGIIGYSGLAFRTFDPDAGWIADVPISTQNNGFDSSLTPPYAIVGVGFTSNLSARSGNAAADSCRLNIAENRGDDELGHVNDPFFASPAIAYREATQYDPPNRESEFYNGGPGDMARVGGPVLPSCFYDYGDAPNSYGTQRAGGGAYHAIVTGGSYFGSGQPDFEVDGQPNATATGDNGTGTDDEDGVTIPVLDRGATTQIEVNVGNVSAGTRLQAWIDWGRDGSFAEAGDQIFIDQAVTDGLNTFDVTVPVDAVSGTTFARFRIAEESGLGATGPASSGEVEDYQVTISNEQPSFGSCTSTMYLAIGGAPTQLHSVDTSTNPFTFPPIGDPWPASGSGYNGIGYSPDDNYIYAPRWNPNRSVHQLLRIGSDGSVQVRGDITGGGINGTDYQSQIASGVIGSDGYLYIKHNHLTDMMWRVDVTTRAATAIPLSQAIQQADFAWHNGTIYTHNHVDGWLYSIDPGTGTVSQIGQTGITSDAFGSMISASNGIFGRLNSGAFYQFDTTTGAATEISDAPAGGGDGAKCPNSPVTLPVDVVVTKDDGSETYLPGGNIFYEIVVSNNGPFGVQNALVNDALPADITTASWTCDSETGGGVCGEANGTGAIVDVPVNLPVGATVTFTLTMSVPPGKEGEIINVVTVTTPDGSPDTNLDNNTARDRDVYPLVRISKALTGEDGDIDDVAEPGETLTYTLTLVNEQGSDVQYNVFDNIDDNTSYVAGSSEVGGTAQEPDQTTDPLLWNGVSIAANTTLTITYDVLVDPQLPADVEEIRNAATQDCAAAPEACVVMPTPGIVTPSKALTDEDGVIDGVAEAGETLTYTVTLTNSRAGDALHDLIDNIDDNTTYVAGSATVNGAAQEPDTATDPLVWNDLPVPGNGTVEVVYQVTVANPLPDGVTEIRNEATDDCQANPDACVTTPTPGSATHVKQLTGETGTIAGVAEPGETLTYTVTLINNDADDALEDLADNIDDNTTYVAGSAAVGGAAQEPTGTDPLEWRGLIVPANGTLQVVYQVQVVDPIPDGVEEIGNVVYRIGEPEPDCKVTPTPPECVILPVPSKAMPSKALTDESGEADNVAEPGETLTYTVTITNSSANPTLYDLADNIDDNTTYVAGSATVGGAAQEPDTAGDPLVWNDLVVPANGTLDVVYQVTVADTIPEDVTEIRNIAFRQGEPEPDCTARPNQCAITEPQAPSLTLVKEGEYEDTDGNGFANAGDTIRYTFTVTNTGNVPVNDVVPEDAGPTFAGKTAENKLSEFTPESARLEPGEEQAFTATYTLGQSDIDNGAGVEDAVENEAKAIGYVNGDQVTGTKVESEGSEATVTLPAAASNISIAKIANLRAIRRGEQAPFTIRVTNLAGSRVDGLTVVDRIPPGFRYVEGSATVGDVAVEPVEAGREIRFENLSLEGNQEIEIRLRMLALSSAGPGEHVNRARAEDASGRQLAPEAQAVVEILAEPVFDCGDVIGKVFDDVNRNGYQDQGEPGLPGVRVATVKGWLITTDEYGRFHVACADLPEARIGSNFIMKLDTRTLPTGYRLTTENPRVVRLTAGKTTKLNFGAAVGRVVRLELTDAAFAPDAAQLKPEWAESVDRLIGVLAEEQSVLRLTYFYGGVDRALAGARIMQARELIAERWRRRGGAYRLEIEMRVEAVQ